jgi:hypothetical protein
MSGGMEDGNRAQKAYEATDEVCDALAKLFKTDAYDRIFGLNGNIIDDINMVLKPFGYEIKKK